MMTNIKNKIILIFLISFILTINCFVSCNNFSGELNNSHFSNEENTVYIKSDDDSENSRGTLKIQIITPTERTATASMELDYLSEISLTGEKDGVVHAFGNWSNIMDVQGRTFSIPIGQWTVTLTGNYNGYTFLDSKNIIIESGLNQNISFELTSTSTTGGLEFSVYFPSSIEALYTTYEIKKYPSNEAVSSGTGNLELQSSEYSKFIRYSRQASSSLASGTYRIVFSFYGDSNKTVLLNTYSEIIHIKGGFLTTCIRTIVLNELFTITYHYPSDAVMNEGDTLIENYSINSRYEDIIFPDLSKTGYDWHGWYTMENGNGDLVTALPLNSTGNKNYYAYFTPHSYTITYELYGGSHVISNPYTYTIEDDIILNPAEKANYIFDGWYTDTSWTTRFERIIPGTTGNITLYAKWEADPSNINVSPSGFPGTYSCYWTYSGTSPNYTITITIKDSSGAIITPDSINIQVCINGEPAGYAYTSQSFEYPSAILTYATPGNNSFYVTVTIGSNTYDFYAVSE